MNLRGQAPIFRLLLPFTLGIITAVCSTLYSNLILYSAIVLLIAIIILILFKQLNLSYKYSWLFGLLTFVVMFLTGIELTTLKKENLQFYHIGNYADSVNILCLRINDPIQEKKKSYKAIAEVISVKQNNHWVKSSGKIICYFRRDSLASTLKYGDILLANGKLQTIQSPRNPGDFNYKQYLIHHNIFYQAYFGANSWKLLEHNKGNYIISLSYSIREYLLNIYRRNHVHGEEFSVGSALILGYNDKLDQDLLNAYSGTGTMHILSVSGLHVGIIYLLLNYIFRFMDTMRYGKQIRALLILLMIWLYALLTGLSPAVLRSAVMFSIVAIAQGWRYSTNIFNTLAVACFVLLLYNPFLITDVGFQLSFLAVLGIVAIQPWLYEKWQPQYWITDQIWKITSVSIAAQLATFPLGLFYFHQFPNYFLISNLLVIPLSSLILIYGLSVFILTAIPIIGIYSGKLFSYMIYVLNSTVRFLEGLPGAVTQNIHISLIETFCIYILVIIVLVFIYTKQYNYLIGSLTMVLVLITLQVIKINRAYRQQAIIIYATNKTPIYDFIKGRTVTSLSRWNTLPYSVSAITTNRYERKIKQINQLIIEKAPTTNSQDLFLKNNYIKFGGKTIVLADSRLSLKFAIPEQLSVDLIVLSQNTKVKIKDLLTCYNFKKLIIDSSNSSYKNEKWKKECRELKIDCYSVPDNGAYVEEL